MYKVYSSWAFSKNENEKAESNRQTYKEICKKWRIKQLDRDDKTTDSDNYDLIISRSAGYNYSTYHIVKNETDLSQDELNAVLCVMEETSVSDMHLPVGIFTYLKIERRKK